MFVSGALKNKSIDFYREKTTSFDSKGINTSEVYFSYEGELTFAPWDKDKERKLILHEEKHINLLDEKIHGLLNYRNKCGTDYLYFNSELNKLIGIIKNFDRRVTFVLLETLYKCFSTTNDRIYTITEFNKLLTYLEDKYMEFDQTTIDSIMYLFSKGYNYDEDSLHNYIINRFKVDSNKLDGENYNLYKLGEFISPNKLSKVGHMIESEHSKYVLPIYFLTSDSRKSERFLSLCKTPYLDRDLAVKNAENVNINANVISLIK